MCKACKAMQRSLCELVQKYLQKQNLLHLLFLRFSSTEISIHADDGHKMSPRREYEAWSSLIWAVAEGGAKAEMASCKASEMLNSGNQPNAYVLIHLVRAATNLGLIPYAQQLHSYILRSGFGSNVFISTALLGFYVSIESLEDAHKLFVEIPEPTVVSWNSLITGYVRSGQFRKALGLFLELERSNICADAFSCTAALTTCGRLGLLQLGESIHSKTVKLGMEWSVVVANCLIDMYGKCGYLQEAIRIFNRITCKDTISWNSVISACARNGELERAFHFLDQMPDPDTISYNELINGIAQFGDMEDAIKILRIMASPNSSSWNSIITGYVNRDLAWEALDFFNQMQSEDVEMDQFTYSSILSGIAGLAALNWGMLIHCCTVKCGLDESVVVGSALIDMYSKCGQVKNAELMFHSLPRKNLVTWNALISGFAHNGKLTEVINLFKKLKTKRDLKPDGITFLNVLLACSHNEVPLQVAIQYFESMIKEYGIEATAEHCCSMIRLMGQRGEAWRVERMIYELGFGLCGAVWRALLGACGACGDLQVAKVAAAKVIELEGHNNEFVYVTMSNIYACHGKWGDVSGVRKLMRKKGVRKGAGCSWIEVENVIPASLCHSDD